MLYLSGKLIVSFFSFEIQIKQRNAKTPLFERKITYNLFKFLDQN